VNSAINSISPTEQRRRLAPLARPAWRLSRILQIQFHDVRNNDLEQFRTMNTQTVVTPAEYRSGDVIYPYEKAKR
jgi:branched-chain amino acid transport system substrate-binding protein